MKAAIEERLRVLEDERDILRTLYIYGHSLDYGEEADFVGCWTEDATLLWRSTGLLKGRGAIASAFRAHTHAPAVFHKHLVMEPLITINGDSANVDSMFVRLDSNNGIPEIRCFGRYRDMLVRCPDDRWRFRARRAEIEASRSGSRPSIESSALGYP